MLIGEVIDGKPFRAFGSRATAASATRRYLSSLLETSDLAERLGRVHAIEPRRMTHVAAHPIEARPSATLWLALAGAGLAILTAAGPTLHHRLRWLGADRPVRRRRRWRPTARLRLGEQADQRTALLVILAGAVAMRLALLFVEPYLSSDIYRYIWDGRVQAAGINPYRYVPKAPELAHLRDAAIWPNINRADYAVTIYPPAAQAIFLAVTRVGESVVAMKLGLLLFEAAAMWRADRTVAAPGQRRRRASPLYAWHPLPVWEIAGNGHVDAAMMRIAHGRLARCSCKVARCWPALRLRWAR